MKNNKTRNNTRMFSGKNKGTAKNSKTGAQKKFSSLDVIKSASNKIIEQNCRIPFKFLGSEPVRFADKLYVFPQLMSLNFDYSIGVSNNPASVFNIIAEEEYSFVVHANSRNTAYEVSDLGIHYVAVAQCYAYIAFMMKIYGLSNTYSSTNLAMPRALLLSMGIDPTEVVKRAPSLLSTINSAILSMARFKIPHKFALLKRWFNITQAIYLDRDSEYAQYAHFVPNGFYIYKGYSDKRGGMLQHFAAPHSVDDIIDGWNEISSAILKDEDINMINGDIRKAYDESAFFALTPIEIDYKVEAIYDSNFILGLHNMDVFGEVGNLNIRQEDGYVKQEPIRTKSANGQHYLFTLPKTTTEAFLHSYGDFTTQEHVYAMTQWKARLNNNDDLVDQKFIFCGTEIISTIAMNKLKISDKEWKLESPVHLTTNINFAGETKMNEVVLAALANLTHFNGHPVVNISSDILPLEGMFGDVDAYTVVSAYSLEEINKAHLLTECGYIDTISR